MKQFLAIACILILASTSCSKSPDTIVHADTIPPVIITEPEIEIIDTTWTNWCGTKLACWGDSFTDGPGGWPYPLILGRDLGIDPIITRDNKQFSLHGPKLVYNGGRSGETSTQIKDRFMNDTARWSWSTVIWSGRNNNEDPYFVQAKLDIDTMVRSLRHERYLVLGVVGGDFPQNWKGTAAYQNDKAFNDYLAETYKDHFLDPLKKLQSKAKPTHQDSIDVFVHDITPQSVRFLNDPLTNKYDELHLSPYGYQYISDTIRARLHRCR